MAMIKTNLGMLVDMTVPTHEGNYTDLPASPPGTAQSPAAAAAAALWPGPGLQPGYQLPAGQGLDPDSAKGANLRNGGDLRNGGISNDITNQMRIDAMSSFHSNSQISDAFSLNPFTVAVPYVYYPGALAQMDTLRRANTYRPRWFTVPDDLNQPLQAYETLEYQIKATGGSYLWGMRFVQYSGVWVQQPPTNVVVQITEACTGIELFREFASPAGIAFYTTGFSGRGMALPHILTQPRLFLEPGDINVEMCNLGGTEQNCQLTLYFAEPANIVEESQVADRSRRPA